MELSVAVLVPFVAAAFALPLERRLPRLAAPLLALAPAALFARFVWHAASAPGRTVLEEHSWFPAVDARLSLYLDGLGLVFALLITGIGALVVLYAGAYLAGDPRRGRLLAFLLMFMGAMLGLVLAGNLIVLFVFWEATSFTSYLLIGYDHESPTARRAALQALLVTGGGGLALLAALVLINLAAGTASIPQLLAGPGLAGHAHYGAIVTLFLLGAFTKSAQFPFHFWLPNAMEAPTPVSAYLHSATMVKAGVFAIARFTPVLGGSDLWSIPLLAAGASTMLLGAYLSLREVDYKRILAFSTVSALGTLVLLLGVGTKYGIAAMVVLLVAHALYKGALFMVAGIVHHETGTRDVGLLGGLRRAMPLTAAAAGLAALSLAGLAPLLSFMGKELFLEALLHADMASPLLVAVGAFAAALLVAVAWIAGIRPFVGKPLPTPEPGHDPGPAMLAGPLLLASLGLVFGILPGALADSLLTPAATAIQGSALAVKLTLWHGVTPALLLSATILAGGALAYWLWGRRDRRASRFDTALRTLPDRGYDAGLKGLVSAAAGITHGIQERRLRHHVGVILLALAGLVAAAALSGGWRPQSLRLGANAQELVLMAVMVVSAVGVAVTTSRLMAVMALGLVGYGLAALFLLYSAPDLAVTQLLVETVMLIVFLQVLRRMPRFVDPPSVRSKAARIAVSLLVGAAFLVTFLVVQETALPRDASQYFAEESVPGGKGRNVVNVILVDFRALDTLGEISVLAIAALGIWALLRRGRPKAGGTAAGAPAATAGSRPAPAAASGVAAPPAPAEASGTPAAAPATAAHAAAQAAGGKEGSA
ncbi:MAG TPA: hydrogen gas-evolving membrane-bound hydrogenase subunit E [Candidatus Thermoplasmatota archaeon]|nr:hydrogen gas-evolving membrane-bound hydrogenase subunit E [Candidatus Thermoplasmatota archaeon]